jgi:broad specificity phosphatase PhoE
MTARLTLLSHGETDALRQERFPLDEPLSSAAVVYMPTVTAGLHPVSRVLTSPALAARQTAAHIAGDVTIDEDLRDCDYGCWRGRALAAVHEQEAASLAAWMSDANAAPHGGESVAALIRRVSVWLDAHLADQGRMLAITHAAVIRSAVIAVLQAPAAAFWRIDVEPLGTVELASDGERWVMRAGRLSAKS